MTLYSITECEHGEVGHCDHIAVEDRGGGCLRLDCNVLHDDYCPGGTQTPITIDYTAAERIFTSMIGEWAERTGQTPPLYATRHRITEAIVAAALHLPEDSE